MKVFEKWHIMKIRNYIERMFVVVLLALVGVPAYADSFSVTYTPPQNLEIYAVTNFSYNQTGNYFVMPVFGTTSVSESYFTIPEQKRGKFSIIY